MNLDEISNMNDVQDFIVNNVNLSKHYYYVTLFSDIKKNRFNPFTKSKKLRFGNANASFNDKVDIEVYKDEVILNRRGDGSRPYPREIDPNKLYSEERYILEALLEWVEFYNK
ncbi:hypothetical protein CN964_21275 [Bacillus cereus]|uniref:hypothetical protein n=1 Tax=Bacillus cereus TaxID=1396 RepID=UPI000BF72A47|nr:hypothetical protein [Bacillus cereus]PFJ30943.1 hypothetical protein COI90_20730 [Bacillus cereus]PFO23931.1 hypothetical protein COJ80_16635 [Bacillus cereus]PGN71174.1 hypothetical protein CN964_21275 [Bacillus cereus]